MLKAVIGLIKRSANNTKTHSKSRLHRLLLIQMQTDIFSPTLRQFLCPRKYPYGYIDILYHVEWVTCITHSPLTLERPKRATLVSFLLGLCSSSCMGWHNTRRPCSSRSLGGRPHNAITLCSRSLHSAESVSSVNLTLHASQTLLRLYAS